MPSSFDWKQDTYLSIKNLIFAIVVKGTLISVIFVYHLHHLDSNGGSTRTRYSKQTIRSFSFSQPNKRSWGLKRLAFKSQSTSNLASRRSLQKLPKLKRQFWIPGILKPFWSSCLAQWSTRCPPTWSSSRRRWIFRQKTFFPAFYSGKVHISPSGVERAIFGVSFERRSKLSFHVWNVAACRKLLRMTSPLERVI